MSQNNAKRLRTQSISVGGEPSHPGQYVRKHVLAPKKMSVTQAAAVIGISRPNVSNFLNGKVAATPEMASRIERAFKVPAQRLLDMQATFDAAQAKSKGAPSNTKAYVPPFLAIKANEIEQWASSTVARIRFSVFLRTLVHSTGVGLTKVDFPGNDDAERAGWDGLVEASEGTPWIPQGISGWEFGTSQDIKSKADGDFSKSVKAASKADRANMTFVFVTPRRWPGKNEWVAKAKVGGHWKDVRAYDSSDLEQWVDQSVAAQTWFANETRRPSQDVRSLDKCWSDWADITTPPLPGALFSSAIAAAKRTMLARLSSGPDGPTIIAADSVEEALAFISQLLGESGGPELAAYRDRVLVFDKPGVLPQLSQGAQNFIPIAFDRDVERELGPIARSMQSIVVYPRNAANSEPHVTLEPVSHETFRKALEGMGFDRDRITKCENASARSLTVLRRQLSDVPAIRTPQWAADHKTATSLVPFLLIGAWNYANEYDQVALSLLAKTPHEDLEKECQRLVQLNDAPVWSLGSFRGVVSKIDLLHAIAGAITADDLKLYFSLAKMVLGEDDPTLDLPEDERWAASFHGKSREFSSAFRDGVSETLVLLAVHGNKLFKTRLGIDTEIEAARVVRELLTPITTRRLEANDRDLPTYAEAVPNEFLSIIEADLRTSQPAVLGLLRPVESGIFGSHPSRTGLLWALEGLSWNSDTLPRAVMILGRLAEVEINDNWVNKPINSLQSIFKAWMPQTAASHEARLEVMKKLAAKYPKVAWEICVAQFGEDHQVGHYSHKPRWRPDGYGFGEPFPTWGPIHAFVREMLDMALSWKGHTREMLCDLIERLHGLDETYQAKVWGLVTSWAKTASDDDKAVVREKIRVTVLSRHGVRRVKKSEQTSLTKTAKAAYLALEPADLLNKHQWLFRDTWVDESADELDEEEFDFRKRDERITKLRIDALKEIIGARGLPGIFALSERGKASWQIGRLVAAALLKEEEVPAFLREALNWGTNTDAGVWSKKNLISGALHSLEEDKRIAALTEIAKSISSDALVQLLLLAPFRRGTWKMVDGLPEPDRKAYWKDAAPDWIHDSAAENNEAVERLLAADRPRAAFSCIRLKPSDVESALLFRVLSDIAKGGSEEPGHYQLEQHSIQEAFKQLDKSADLSLEQKAGLEFAYIDALARPWSHREEYGIPNLERYIERHPEMFVQAVVWTYKRHEGGDDPPEFKVAPEDVQRLAERGHKLLDAIERIPGQDEPDDEKKRDRLAAWVKAVRDSCRELDRADVADSCIGKLFASAPAGKDGVWPSEPVRDVMEDIQSEKIFEGTHLGLYNARGAHWRGEGGDQERELADKYRKWANALQFSHPFVASKVLMGMVQTYEHDASREDTVAGIRRRLR